APAGPPAGPAAGWTAPRPQRPGEPAPAAPADDEAASRAQRADAWRRMWGFPEDGAQDQGEQGTQETEEGR
ncbi:hypothetical protein, partial [Cellulomonas triticagri]